MRIAVFVTTDASAGAALLQDVRARHRDAAIVAFVNDDDRRALAPALAGLEVRRDKPVGGKLAFVRALRRERFDLLVVAWHGGERVLPLRLVALLAGAGRVVARDERGRERDVSLVRPWTWAGHAARRLAAIKITTLLRAAAASYRWSIGLVVAGVRLLPAALQRRL